MQEKTIKRWDKKGRLTLISVYEEAIKEIERELAKRPYLEKKTLTYREFRAIIFPYLDYWCDYIMRGFEFVMPNKFGGLRIVKHRIGKRKSFYDDYHTKGYWHSLFWESPDKWNNFKVEFAPTKKKEMMKLVNRGFEYPDYTE